MKLLRILLPALAGVAIALVLLLRPTESTVTILVENQPVVVTTKAGTVAGALAEAGFSPSPQDLLDPPADTPLEDEQVIQFTQAMSITLLADGQTKHLTTTSRLPAEWLDELSISVDADDHLTINGVESSLHQPVAYHPEIWAEVHRALPFTLIRGTERISLKSAAPTLGQALWEAGYTLTESDLLDPVPETPLTDSLTAYLIPGRQVQIEVDGTTLNLTTSADTVGEALSQVGLTVQGLDYSVPAPESPLPDDGKIKVVRVREEVILNQQPIPFTTVYEAVEDLEIDNYEVVQLGQTGIQAQRVRVRYEDGAEASRVVEDQWTMRDPVPRIEGYGTQIVVRTEVASDGTTIEYWRKVDMYVTSYSPCNLGVDWCGETTASGETVRKGLAAVTIEWYRVMAGQTVYVPDYGYATIADVGGGVPGSHWIDVAYTDEEYIGWHTNRTVYFVTPVPPPDQILYVLP